MSRPSPLPPVQDSGPTPMGMDDDWPMAHDPGAEPTTLIALAMGVGLLLLALIMYATR